MRYILLITAFIEGAVVMILELTGSRIIAPYLGTSIIIWTSLIGVILASLSLGYYLGGKWADKNPNPLRLARLILGAAFLIVLIVFFKPFLVYIDPNSFGGLLFVALALTIVLFAPPTVLLGMVTPTIAKLLITDMSTSGRTIGSLYALSTMGSIAGTFLGGFILISFFGSTKILIVLSSVLLLVSVAIYFGSVRRISRVGVPLVALCIFGASFFANPLLFDPENTLVADIDTKYSRIWIYDAIDRKTGRSVRYMTDTVYAIQSGIYKDDPDALLFDYSKMFDMAGHFRPDMREGLMIGAGMYSYPKHFVRAFPNATLDIAEIDPELKPIAERYFGFNEHPSLTIYHEDGRSFLNSSSKRYDVVFIDAFRSEFSIPYQLTTQEAVQRIHDRLDEDGVVIVNIISGIEGYRSELLQAMTKTYHSVFPDVRILKVVPERDNRSIQNVILVAFKNRNHVPLQSSDRLMQSYFDKEVQLVFDEKIPILTDDFAPIEKFMTRMLL